MQTEIREFVEGADFIDHHGEIHIPKFIKLVEEIIADRKIRLVSPEVLLEIFCKTLMCSENFDFVEKDFHKKRFFLN